MQSSFPTAIAFTEKQEGGYSDDPYDSGNWSSGVAGEGKLIGSNRGCGAPATIAYMAKVQPGFTVTAAWMEEMPFAIYEAMATALYWQPLMCDALPAGLDLMCFDFGWNTGISSAAKRLQWLVGATQDGELGPATLAAVEACDLVPIVAALDLADVRIIQRLLAVAGDGQVGPATTAALAASRGLYRPQILALALGEAQEVYYRGLSNFDRYGQDWLNRTASRTITALSLASNLAPGVSTAYLGFRSASAIEPPDAPSWVPFAPGSPILAQAGHT
jgi:lysozyme family protein